MSLFPLLLLILTTFCSSEDLKVTGVRPAKKRPIPKDGPQFDPDKIANTKELTEKDPKFKNHVDVMVVPNFGSSKNKDILLFYFGKWSLKSLVDSKEFAILLPYEFTVGIGYEQECKKDKKEMNRINAFFGDIYKVDVAINGELSRNVYLLLNCEQQLKTAELWGTYDSFKLSSMLIDSQRSPPLFNRIESKEKRLSRYAKTKKTLSKRYGVKGTNFWDWGANNNLFGRRKIIRFIGEDKDKFKNKDKDKKKQDKDTNKEKESEKKADEKSDESEKKEL